MANSNIYNQDDSLYSNEFPTNDFLSIKNITKITNFDKDLSKRQIINKNEQGTVKSGAGANTNVNTNTKANANNNANNNPKINIKATANDNLGNTIINNVDCRLISMVLKEFGLDYGWKNTNDCCMFNRIVCVDETGTKTTETTENTYITDLYFNNIMLNGQIPNSICSLTHLKGIQFVNNSGLTGSIPACIGGMSNLERLVFSNTPISGEIPKSIAALTNLQLLSLENTNIENSIPNEISKLTGLIKLYINNNEKITGTIPEGITNLKNLEMLSFSDTNIGGSIPENIGDLKLLKTFSLHHTSIEGKIPDSIGQLTDLQIIKFHDTKLSGTLPDSFKNLKNLKILTLNNTSIEGKLPEEVKSFPFEECSLDKTKLCLINDVMESNSNACLKALPICSESNNGADGKDGNKKGSSGISFLSYTVVFLGIVSIIALSVYIVRRYKAKKVFQHEKRAINYYKNNISDQPKWMGNNDIYNTPIVHNENIHAYNYNVEQHVDPSVYVRDSFINRFIDGMHMPMNNNNNNYQKLNDFKYNGMGMDDGTIKNNMDDTFINRKNEYIYEYDGMNKSLSQKSHDSEKTEIVPNMGTGRVPYNDSIFKTTNSSGSSIPLPPNSDNMVFMGREAQEELKIFQQNEENKSVKEQLEELEQMASSNYNIDRKSPKASPKTSNLKSPKASNLKSPKSSNLKSPRSYKSPRSPRSPSQNYSNTTKSIDINEQILELKNCSFNGLDLTTDNFHNSFDKIEKKFLSNLDSLRSSSAANENKNEKDKKSEASTTKDKDSKMFTFANIPGLQIQEYYNQLNLSMNDSTDDSGSGWGKSVTTEKEKDKDKKFDKIIPSGIFNTGKTSWDTDDSFSTTESSFRRVTRDTKNTTNTTSINMSALNKEIKNKLGTESMMMEGKKYKSRDSKSLLSDKYSRYKSGATEEEYGYSKYSSGFTNDKYKSMASTEDGYSKYSSGFTNDKYKSMATTEDGYSKYSSGITDNLSRKLSDDYTSYDTISYDNDKSSKYDSHYSEYTNVVITDHNNNVRDRDRERDSSSNKKKKNISKYASSNTELSAISKDYTISTGYSSTGYTLSNANTLSSGFTLDSKTISSLGQKSNITNNSSRTTKSSLNVASNITGSNTDSLFTDFSKFSSLDSMGTLSSVSSLSITDDDDLNIK